MSTKAKPKRYSDNDRAVALAALAANGGNIKRTARELDIPPRTLRNWSQRKYHPEAAESASQKKTSLADALESAVRSMVNAVAGKIDTASLQQLATAIGILVDKMRLLRNEPTEIARTEGAIDDPLTRKIDQLADAFARAADREEAGTVPADSGGEPVDSSRD